MMVEKLYLDAIRLEKSSLAHYIHHLLVEKKISLDEDIHQ